MSRLNSLYYSTRLAQNLIYLTVLSNKAAFVPKEAQIDLKEKHFSVISDSSQPPQCSMVNNVLALGQM